VQAFLLTWESGVKINSIFGAYQERDGAFQGRRVNSTVYWHKVVVPLSCIEIVCSNILDVLFYFEKVC